MQVSTKNLNIVERKKNIQESLSPDKSRQNAPLCEAEEEEEEVSTTLLEVEEPELAGGVCWC